MNLKFLVWVMIFGAFLGCKKDSNSPNVPYVPVDYTISLSLPSMSGLNQVGGYAYLNNLGYKGIVVFKFNADTYIAFDRSCTYQPTEGCHKIEIDATNSFVANCACCESKYSMDGGLVLKAPASRSLTRYKVEVLTSLYSLRISNEY